MFTRSTIRAGLFAGAAALLLATPPTARVAYAAGIPAEGPIDTTFTWTAKPQTMPTVGGREAYIAEEWLVLTAANLDSILDKLAARCLAMGDQSTDGSSYMERGNCTLTDADGDHVFETYDVTDGKGTGKLIGGTGKFQGITGELEITTAYFGSPAEGTYQGVGHKKGSYKIVK